MAPLPGYLLTPLPISIIRQISFIVHQHYFVHLRRGSYCESEAFRTITKRNERDKGISNLNIAIQIIYRD